MMMKQYQIDLLLLLAFAIIGCTFGLGFAQSHGNRPEDFSINYQRTAGSVPPPYYHEMRITISPSGEGEIELIPDHPADSVPRWTESFNVDAQTLDDIYGRMVAEEAFTRNWQAPSQPMLGAADERVQITANGQQTEIPSRIARDQSRSKNTITKAVQALVPDSLWKSLKERHRLYSKERYPSGAQ
jgi:hypothetical protein